MQPKDAPLEYKQIVTTSKTAPYQTSAALYTCIPVEDSALLRWCREQDCLSHAAKCWMGILATTSKVMISHPKVYDGKFFVTTPAHLGVCVRGLPVTKLSVTTGKLEFYDFAALDQHYYLPVLNPKEWRCAP